MAETELNQEQLLPVKCEVCGCQDETVRFVTYPYVYSFVVVTFQRAFTGCWCRLHRNQRWFAASFITSIFGWLGIPFGIVLTPARLLQLARGGLQDNMVNGQILRLIGEQKLRNGDLKSAIRCFEASLMYVNDPEINEQLRSLYRSLSSDSESPIANLASLLVFPVISIVFTFLGVFVGVLDFIVRWLSSFLPPELSIFVLILLQVPFVSFVYFGVAFLSYAFQPAVRLSRINSALFLSFAGVITSLLFINGIISGGTYGLYFRYFMNGFRELPDEILTTLIAILTRGGLYIFNLASFTSNFSGNVIYAVLLFLSFFLFILVLMPKAKILAVQQERIAQLQSLEAPSENAFPLFAWAGLIGVLVFFLLLFVATPQKSSVDGLEAFDHVNLAIGYENLGDYNRAVDEYKLAIELKPSLPLSYIRLGYAYYVSGDYGQAQESFDVALELQPNSMESHSGLGWVYLQKGEYELAGEEFNDALRIDPQNLDSHLGLGWLYLNQFDLVNSRKEFEYVKYVAPELAESYYGLGTLELSISNYENAIDLLDEAIRLNPNIVVAHIYKGYAYFRQDMYSDAENAFQSALKIQPDNYSALNGLGDIRVANYKFEEGIDYYDKAITIDPGRIDAPFGRASVLIQMGKFGEAASILESLDNQYEFILPTLAYSYYQLNRNGDADKILEEASNQASQKDGVQQARAYMAIAGTYSSTYRFPEAKKYLELAKIAYPVGPDSDFYITYSYVLSAMGEFSEAEAALQQLAQIGHSDIALSVAEASLLIDQEDLTGAEKTLLAALQKNGNSAALHALMAFVYYQNHTLTLSVNEARAAIRLNPNNSNAYLQLAYDFQASGRTDEALKAAKEAQRLNPLENNTHYILGVCYMEKGMNELAINEFKRFLGNYWDRAYVRDYKVKAEEYLAKLEQNP